MDEDYHVRRVGCSSAAALQREEVVLAVVVVDWVNGWR